MGNQMQGSLSWSALLFLSFVAAQSADATRAEQLIVVPQLQQRHLKFLNRLSKVEIPPGVPAARRLLQSNVPLCYWDEDSCMVRYESNAPDPEIAQIAIDEETCPKISSKDDCLDVPQCFWDEIFEDPPACDVDFSHGVKDCFDPNYMVILRAGQCPSLFRKANCLSLPGCQWNETDAKCQVDQVAINEAVGASPKLSAAVAQHSRCQSFDPCVSPCSEDDEGDCVYFPFTNGTEWIMPTATSAFCQYTKMGLNCAVNPADSTCTGMCEIDEQGECDLSDRVAIEFLFKSSEAEQARWLDAADACSAIDDPDDCESFIGGK